MDVIARAVAFVEVAVAAQVQEVELVDQAVAFQQVDGSVDRYLRDSRVQLARAFQDFACVEVTAGCFHYLQKDAALTRQANASCTEFTLQTAWRFVVDAFACGDAMCGGSCHHICRL